MLTRTTTWMLMVTAMSASSCGGDDPDPGDDETRGGEGRAERVGEAVDDAAHGVRHGVRRAADETGEAIESAGDHVEDATDDDD